MEEQMPNSSSNRLQDDDMNPMLVYGNQAYYASYGGVYDTNYGMYQLPAGNDYERQQHLPHNFLPETSVAIKAENQNSDYPFRDELSQRKDIMYHRSDVTHFKFHNGDDKTVQVLPKTNAELEREREMLKKSRKDITTVLDADVPAFDEEVMNEVIQNKSAPMAQSAWGKFGERLLEPQNKNDSPPNIADSNLMSLFEAPSARETTPKKNESSSIVMDTSGTPMPSLQKISPSRCEQPPSPPPEVQYTRERVKSFCGHLGLSADNSAENEKNLSISPEKAVTTNMKTPIKMMKELARRLTGKEPLINMNSGRTYGGSFASPMAKKGNGDTGMTPLTFSEGSRKQRSGYSSRISGGMENHAIECECHARVKDMKDFKCYNTNTFGIHPHLCDQSRALIARIGIWNREYSKRLESCAPKTAYQKADELTASQMGFCSATIRKCIDFSTSLNMPKCSMRSAVTQEAADKLLSTFQSDTKAFGNVMDIPIIAESKDPPKLGRPPKRTPSKLLTPKTEEGEVVKRRSKRNRVVKKMFPIEDVTPEKKIKSMLETQDEDPDVEIDVVTVTGEDEEMMPIQEEEPQISSSAKMILSTMEDLEMIDNVSHEEEVRME